LKNKECIACIVENAGRSQMDEAFPNKYGKGKLTAQNAGVKLAP